MARFSVFCILYLIFFFKSYGQEEDSESQKSEVSEQVEEFDIGDDEVGNSQEKEFDWQDFEGESEENKDVIDIFFEDEYFEEYPKLIPFRTVRQKDIAWSKIVWETIDLKMHINKHLYIPEEKIQDSISMIDSLEKLDESKYEVLAEKKGEPLTKSDSLILDDTRKTLFDIIIKAIENKKITKLYADSGFQIPITYKDVEFSTKIIDTLDAGYEQYNAGEQISKEYISKTEITSKNIEEIRLKSMWYFDRLEGKLKYRILGFAFASKDIYFLTNKDKPLINLFWVWYKDAREVLHYNKCYYRGDSSDDFLTFDEILLGRYFKSTIYRDQNIYDNRSIKDYKKKDSEKQLEAIRIKEKTLRNQAENFWTR